MEKRICLCNACYKRDKGKCLFDLNPLPVSTTRTHKSKWGCDGPPSRPPYLDLGQWQVLQQRAVENRKRTTLQDAVDTLFVSHYEAHTHSANPSGLNVGTCNAGPSNHQHDHQQPEQNEHGDGILGDPSVVDHVADEGMSDDAGVHGPIFSEDLEALHGVFPGYDGGKLCTDRETRKYPDLERLLDGVHLEDRVKKYCYQLIWDKVVHKMTVAQVESQLQATAHLVRLQCSEHDKPCPWYPCTFHQLMAVVFGADDGCKLGNEVIYDVCAKCYTVYRGLEEVHNPASTCRKCESPREGCLKYHYRQVIRLC